MITKKQNKKSIKFNNKNSLIKTKNWNKINFKIISNNQK